MAEGDEPVTLALPGGPGNNNSGLLDLAVRREEGANGVSGGLRAEAADEELALALVAVGDSADVGEDARLAAGHGGGDDVAELVEGEGVNDFTAIFRRQFDRRDGGGEGAVLVRLPLLVGRIHQSIDLAAGSDGALTRQKVKESGATDMAVDRASAYLY